MTINLVLPQIGSGGGGTKDHIISILSQEWPLSTKEIKSRISKQFSGELTYQAVHKALNELEQQKVLKKENGTYELSKDWVDGIESFAKSLIEQRYVSPEFIDGKAIVTNSLYETDIALFEIASKIVGRTDKKPLMCLHWFHSWIPLFLNNEKYQKLKYIVDNTETYSLIKNNTIVDKWICNYLVKRGAHEKTGVDVASTVDFVILGDYVIQVFYPVHLKKELNRVFSSVKDISELDTGELFEKVFMKPAKITIIVTRNKHLAEQLREETLEHFKENSK